MNEAKALLELTSTDHALLKIKKQIDDLPMRQQLLELRTRRAEVEKKGEQVAQMRKECEQAIKLLQDEEATIQEKTAVAQKQIDETSNYKEVAALTHEIEGFAKRLEKIEFDTFKQFERSDKITQVEKQVAGALEKLSKQDEEMSAVYQKQVNLLRQEIATAQQLRDGLAAALPPDLLKRYEKARESKGGFGAAFIEERHCSGCRVEFTEGQLMKLKNGDEIGECPFCHRLLVIAP